VGKRLIQFSVKGSTLHYSTRLKRWHKFFYRQKIRAMTDALLENVDVANEDIIHAHMLCTDGAVAYEMSKRFGIPYLVAVQNTDLHTYYKTFWWERPYFAKILMGASKVVFVSPKYRQKLLDCCLGENLRQEVLSKSLLIPFGISDLFLAHRTSHAPNLSSPVRLVFVGAFYPGKRLQETIEATDVLRGRGRSVELTAIGRGLPHRGLDKGYISRMEDMAAIRPWVQLKDFMSHEKLVEELRASDIFVMPSSPESFGLVYVEALSQGLPIVYTKGEGFDGYYENGNVGWPVNPKNPVEIADRIESIMEDYAGFAKRVANLDLERDFCWSRIAKKYKDLYSSILGSGK
jgi:glycosyltransferase involved in cell wall biosynthesis